MIQDSSCLVGRRLLLIISFMRLIQWKYNWKIALFDANDMDGYRSTHAGQIQVILMK
jgi:hypothetical protein